MIVETSDQEAKEQLAMDVYATYISCAQEKTSLNTSDFDAPKLGNPHVPWTTYSTTMRRFSVQKEDACCAQFEQRRAEINGRRRGEF